MVARAMRAAAAALLALPASALVAPHPRLRAPRVLRSAPQFAITLSAFDLLRQAAVDQGLLTIAG